ncbi:phage portal protein, partial [Riemerella anatipestifer]
KFDENDNLISFAREFKNGNKTIFEVYTDERIIRYEQEKEWKKISDIPNAIGKIPIVYYKQENVEWADVQTAIERLEHIYSNTAESNDRFSFPILKLKGKVTGQLSQDKSGRVLQLEEGADAEFANQPQA